MATSAIVDRDNAAQRSLLCARLSRRRSSITHAQQIARDNSSPQFAKSVELENRLGRLELCCSEFASMLKLLRQQLTALQAQVDHLDARLNRT